MSALKSRREVQVDLGDGRAPVGSRPWATHVAIRIQIELNNAEFEWQTVALSVETFKLHEGYKALGYPTWDAFCVKRMQATAGQIDEKIKNRQIAVANLARVTTPLSEVGPPKGTRNAAKDTNNDYNCNHYFHQQGNRAKYLAGRIARDHPEVLARMKSGEYKSVRAAAIDCGVIDPDKARRYQLPTEPTAAARYLRTRVDKDWLGAFVAAWDTVSSD